MVEFIGPTKERSQHDPLRVATDVLTYDLGGRAQRTSAVPRTIDLLGSLARRAAITEDEAAAGNRFRRDFTHAQLSSLKSSGVFRALLSTRDDRRAEVSNRVVDSRDAVYGALSSLGGIVSKESSALYHVIGLEWTLKRWTHEMRRCKTPETASRILVRALKQLCAYYASGP